MLPFEAKKIVIEFYDAYTSQSFDSIDPDKDDSVMDNDKIQHSKIGQTEISVNKVIQNLLVMDEYITHRNIFHFEENSPVLAADDDLYSSHSQYRMHPPDGHPQAKPTLKGRLHLSLKADLHLDYLDRMEA